jgi:acetyl esterase/lipase
MKKWAVVLVACLVATSGCLKAYDRTMNQRRAVKNHLEYGPMELYGAKCDHELWDVPYAPGLPYSKYLTLDVYWNEHEGPAPIVIQVHGGGWEVGDKRSLESVFKSKYLTAHGYVVMSVNYRMKPEVPIQKQVEDVMAAVIWAKENAARFGGDPNKVGVTGGSAGGHLTAMIAWASNDPYFKPTSPGSTAYRADVKAAVPFYGVYDLEELLMLHNEYLRPITYSYFTGKRDKQEQNKVLLHVSPKYHLRKDLPPTFFICGDRDEFDIYHDAQTFTEQLRELGVPTGLYTAQGAKHAFDLDYGTQNTKEAMEAMVGWFDKYLK